MAIDRSDHKKSESLKQGTNILPDPVLDKFSKKSQ